jgi:hypothetical protein
LLTFNRWQGRRRRHSLLGLYLYRHYQRWVRRTTGSFQPLQLLHPPLYLAHVPSYGLTKRSYQHALQFFTPAFDRIEHVAWQALCGSPQYERSNQHKTGHGGQHGHPPWPVDALGWMRYGRSAFSSQRKQQQLQAIGLERRG